MQHMSLPITGRIWCVCTRTAKNKVLSCDKSSQTTDTLSPRLLYGQQVWIYPLLPPRWLPFSHLNLTVVEGPGNNQLPAFKKRFCRERGAGGRGYTPTAKERDRMRERETETDRQTERQTATEKQRHRERRRERERTRTRKLDFTRERERESRF